nr:DinB family protein [Peribacillus psychrosaccharolyticus]
MAKGKWSIAEIVGHLIPWDEFVLTKRIPYFLTSALLPKSPESDLVNQQSAEESRNRSKKETIKLFMSSRKLLIQSLNDLPDELWKQDLSIGGNSISLMKYFKGLVEHDIHHIRQIQSVFGDL